MKLRHVGFSVSDEKQALRFYRDLLGFKVITKSNEDSNYAKRVLGITNLTYIKLKGESDTLLELYLMPRDKEKGRWNHIALTVKSIDEIYNRLLIEKIKFLSEPVLNPLKTVKLCFCKDFDSNLIELVEEITTTQQIKISKRKRVTQKIVKKIPKRGLADIKKTKDTISEEDFKKGDSEEALPQS